MAERRSPSSYKKLIVFLTDDSTERIARERGEEKENKQMLSAYCKILQSGTHTLSSWATCKVYNKGLKKTTLRQATKNPTKFFQFSKTTDNLTSRNQTIYKTTRKGETPRDTSLSKTNKISPRILS